MLTFQRANYHRVEYSKREAGIRYNQQRGIRSNERKSNYDPRQWDLVLLKYRYYRLKSITWRNLTLTWAMNSKRVEHNIAKIVQNFIQMKQTEANMKHFEIAKTNSYVIANRKIMQSLWLGCDESIEHRNTVKWLWRHFWIFRNLWVREVNCAQSLTISVSQKVEYWSTWPQNCHISVRGEARKLNLWFSTLNFSRLRTFKVHVGIQSLSSRFTINGSLSF